MHLALIFFSFFDTYLFLPLIFLKMFQLLTINSNMQVSKRQLISPPHHSHNRYHQIIL